VAPAVLVGVIAVGGSLASGSHQPSARPLDAVSILLLVGGAGALLARRRWPIATLVTTVVLLVGYLSAGYPYGPVVLPFLAAVINAVLAGHRRVVWLIAAAGYAGLIGAVHIREGWPGWWAVTGIAAWLLVVLTLAELARARVERHQRARREQREAARQRATEERLRIARELHDVLAHHVSLINVQAGSALHVLDRRSRATLSPRSRRRAKRCWWSCAVFCARCATRPRMRLSRARIPHPAHLSRGWRGWTSSPSACGRPGST
jgi:signal transduction histidine kinase